MKVLVTGATGFLGSHVADVLKEQGHDMRALVRKTSDTRHLKSIGAKLVNASLEEGECLDKAFVDIDAVIHCAGLVKARSSDEFTRVNALGTKNLLDAALKYRPNLKRFVYVSSLAAHGPSLDGQPRAVDAEATPVTQYGRSKLEGEKYVLEVKDKIPVTIIRPPAIYGPRDKEIFMFFQSAARRIVPLIGSGDNSLSMIYGPDCARAIVSAINKEHPSGRIYFVDDGQTYTWHDMADYLEKALGTRVLRLKVPMKLCSLAAWGSELYGRVSRKSVMLTRDKLNEAKEPYWICSGDPIRKELGWTPEIDFEQGAKLTADWYRAHGWL